MVKLFYQNKKLLTKKINFYKFLENIILWCVLHYDVCRIMTFVALWRLSHYDVCRIMTFVALWRLSFMTFVVLWCLLHYDVCRQLWRLSPIMTFAAYRVCRSIKKGQQKVPILKRTTVLWPSRSYYSMSRRMINK